MEYFQNSTWFNNIKEKKYINKYYKGLAKCKT